MKTLLDYRKRRYNNAKLTAENRAIRGRYEQKVDELSTEKSEKVRKIEREYANKINQVRVSFKKITDTIDDIHNTYYEENQSVKTVLEMLQTPPKKVTHFEPKDVDLNSDLCEYVGNYYSDDYLQIELFIVLSGWQKRINKYTLIAVGKCGIMNEKYLNLNNYISASCRIERDYNVQAELISLPTIQKCKEKAAKNKFKVLQEYIGTYQDLIGLYQESLKKYSATDVSMLFEPISVPKSDIKKAYKITDDGEEIIYIVYNSLYWRQFKPEEQPTKFTVENMGRYIIVGNQLYEIECYITSLCFSVNTVSWGKHTYVSIGAKSQYKRGYTFNEKNYKMLVAMYSEIDVENGEAFYIPKIDWNYKI